MHSKLLIWAYTICQIVAIPLEGSIERSTGVRQITVDASTSLGKFKNLQGTNNGDTSIVAPGLDNIHDMVPAIADLWPAYGIQHVLICKLIRLSTISVLGPFHLTTLTIDNWPDVFTGYGKLGLAGDASDNANYNWTVTDAYVRFITSRGAKASIQFHHTNGTNDTLSSPTKLGQIGFMITDRYMNGAYGSGFKDALELFDFYAESDLEDATAGAYEQLFGYFAGFSRGVAKASTKAGVGAWGGNRIVPLNTNYSLYDPFVSRFYADCKSQNVPIKAATYHFTNAQYSFNPYDVKKITDTLRSQVLVPAGFPNLPIWVTESEPNPSGIQPTSVSAIASYNDPAFFASYTLGVSMYGQDTSIEQILPWTGFGYGGTGAGNAPFQPWFNKTSTNPAVPLNVAAAWKLQTALVMQTPQRIALDGSSPDGFAALAGSSKSSDQIQVLLNNYQLNYDIVREIAAQSVPLFNTSTTAYPILQSNGLLNGQQACFLPGTQFFVPVCQTFLQATIRDNESTAYKLVIKNLPWGKNTNYKLVIQRAGGGVVQQVVETVYGTGNSIAMTIPFPANAQDLVTITKM